MSINQKRAVLIIAGVIILVCTFFLLYQPNSDTVLQLETETNHYQSQINYLSALQLQVNKLKEQTPKYEKEMLSYMKAFPCKMTQQKAIYNVYKMMVKTGIRVSAIQPGVEQIFLGAGKFTDSAGVSSASPNNTSGNTSDAAGTASQSAVEVEPDKEVPVHEMVGKMTPYELNISGTLRQIKKALDWISKNDEHMATTNISLTYDSSSGKLSGTLTVNFFSMNGNGVPYEEPDIRGITIGSKNIFGTVK